jgi:hypothetical protein
MATKTPATQKAILNFFLAAWLKLFILAFKMNY